MTATAIGKDVNSRMKLTFLSTLCLLSPIVVSSCYLHCCHRHHCYYAMHTLVGAPSNADAHCRHLPSPPPLWNASLLPLSHRCLAVIHCRCHPPPALLNAIFVTVSSPPPQCCPSLPLSNAIVILHCHHCCFHSLPLSNTDAHHGYPPPLVSNAIYALPLPCLTPLPLMLNAIEHCCRHQTPLPLPPLNTIFIVHQCRCCHHRHWCC